jgi:ribosome assembly protein 4
MPGESTVKSQPWHRPSKKLVKPIEQVPNAPTGMTVVAQFTNPEGISSGPPLNLPVDSTPEQLMLLLNNLLNNEESLPYTFFVNDVEINNNLYTDIHKALNLSSETALEILYRPLAVFRVRSVGRCSASLSGRLTRFIFRAYRSNIISVI